MSRLFGLIGHPVGLAVGLTLSLALLILVAAHGVAVQGLIPAPLVPSGGHDLPNLLRWHPLADIFFCLALGVLVAVLAHGLKLELATRAQARTQAALEPLAARIAQLEAEKAELAAAERKYRDMYETALEGLFITDTEGRFLSANPALVNLLGYESEAELKRCIANASADLYMDQENRAEITRTVLKQGFTGSMELEVRRRDGTPIWVALTARIIRDAAGTPIAFQGAARDITERRLDRLALEQALAAAEMANRAKSEFLANMSHELRTPLNAVIGFSEIIGTQALGPMGNANYVEYAQDIHDSGLMLLELINDILDLSKIEAGKKELQERVVDVPRIVRASLRLVRERAEKGGVALETDMTESLPPVRADEVALKQILSNLLTNAVKFTKAGGTVTCGARLGEGGRLELVVRDTGIGMREEDIAKALEPFRQVEGSLSRQAGGVGLGLPLVQALARLHGGGCLVKSRLGQGTTVTVWLPADRVQDQPHLFLAGIGG
ncbi:ATP-binding protein [Niveispirillum sp. BGYR6]|uniref:PAS domain-containing sensor histidine kinase n=1 Tax=Niveispirillum sp. BGYR6 TaxID=2971249 RepID=UPI0022B9A1F6|nr:ATP-binding protein [Niveispirillum sp. BGYR6]